eukprot:scpid17175/ scgid8598/ 
MPLRYALVCSNGDVQLKGSGRASCSQQRKCVFRKQIKNGLHTTLLTTCVAVTLRLRHSTMSAGIDVKAVDLERRLFEGRHATAGRSLTNPTPHSTAHSASSEQKLTDGTCWVCMFAERRH